MRCWPFRYQLGGLFQIVLAVSLAVGLQIVLAETGHAEAASDLAEDLLVQVNAVRGQHGVPPLAASEPLRTLATERSADMVSRRYFSHVTPEGATVFSLMAARGITYSVAGENLAWNTGDEHDASNLAFQSLINSPSHYDNLLRRDFNQAGVGVASGGGRTYFTLILLG